MAAVTTVGSLNAFQPPYIIFVYVGAGHSCQVKLYLLHGTNVATMRWNRKCILVSCGRIEYLGLHLDA
jgi:hypothetical protein